MPSGFAIARASLAVTVLAAGFLTLPGALPARAQIVSEGGDGGGPNAGGGGSLNADGSTDPAGNAQGTSGGGGGAPTQPGGIGSGGGGNGGYGGSTGADASSFDANSGYVGGIGNGGASVLSSNDAPVGAGGGGAGGTGVLFGTGTFATRSNITGGDAGNGGSAFFFGYGAPPGDISYNGNGGMGGVGILVTGDAILTSNSGNVTGGYGGTGGSGSGISGRSGIGGTGIFIANGATNPNNIFTNTGVINGGHGGNAPYVFEADVSGANGGNGLVILGGSQFVNQNIVQGGQGGEAPASGTGGRGGSGIRATGTSESLVSIVNDPAGTIAGGVGGSPDNPGATPGVGGIGISASYASIVNRGFIIGGSAGPAFEGQSTVSGGDAIVGSNLTVRTSGTIIGGSGTDGNPAEAIRFSGGANTLILEPGYFFGSEVIVGSGEQRRLAATPAADAGATGTLALGSSDTGVNNFDVGTIGSLFQGFTAFQKIESGRWTLIRTNTDALTWQVLDGTLVVDGALPNSTFNVGDVPIDPIIGGGGTIGTLVVGNNGVVAPGIATQFTTLTVTGNATFNPGSVYQVQIGPAGQTDRLAVGGTTTISPTNTTVNVIGIGGPFSPNTQYVILTSAGGLTPGSRFAGATASNLAFLQPLLTYDANDVFLTLVENGTTFPSVANTPNQKAAAGGLQSLGPGSPLYNLVLSQGAAGARQAFDATSGEPHASVQTAGINSASFISSTIFDRLWNLGGAGNGDAYQLLQSFGSTLPTLLRCYAVTDAGSAPLLSSYSAWGQAFGSFGRNGGNGNAAAIDQSTGGFVAGVDIPIYGYFSDVWRFGVAGGYLNDSLSVSNRASSGTYESAFGSLYGGMRAGAVDLRFGASAGTDSTNLRRNVAFPGLLELERSSYGGTTVQGFGEIGYRFAYGLNVIEPVAGFTAVHLQQDSFNEKGGIAALHGFSSDTDVETTSLGFRGEMLPFNDLPLVARIHLAWQHAFGDLNPATTVAFRAGGAAFRVEGAPIDRDSALAEVGLDYRVSNATTLGLDYAGQVGSRDYQNGVRGRFNYRF